MKLLVYARRDLVDRTLGPDSPALLLEGSWSPDAPPAARWSLDEAIDGRFDWIDQQAAPLADLLAETGHWPARLAEGASAFYLGALELRYYLVKLIRLVAYFCDVRPLRPGDVLELTAAKHRDHDYADLLRQLSRIAHADCRVRWTDDPCGRRQEFPPNGRLRRWAGRLAELLQPRQRGPSPRPRVVLCGNPQLLDPICRELVARRVSAWWLYDRFALRSWLRWRPSGLGQLLCNSSLGRENRLCGQLPDRLDCCGVNLAPSLGHWLAGRMAAHGPRQTRLLEQIDAHFRRVRPDTILLDEDATPLARAAVAVGRHFGAASLVVQHGAPCCRFGFAPLAADRILVWGRSSRRQLIRWGVSPEQIRITGSPRHDRLWAMFRGARRHAARTGSLPRKPGTPLRVLLLATMPPSDHRPDAVAFHLTSRTYGEMLRRAFSVLAGMPRIRLTVKLHPRAGDDPIARAELARFPWLRARIVRHGCLEKWLPGVDCVLSCGSSAGVEATLAGIPVIQLLPAGASDFLPHSQWGLAGTARSEAELDWLLARLLNHQDQQAPVVDPNVFGNIDRPAAAQIVEQVLALAAGSPDEQRGPAGPHFHAWGGSVGASPWTAYDVPHPSSP